MPMPSPVRDTALALLLWLATWGQVGAAGWDLGQVMAAIAANAYQAYGYREEKHLALLERPLRSSGRLSLVPPDTLVREVESPDRVRYAIGRDEVMTTEQGDLPPRVMQLSRYPAAGALVGTLRALLLGDRAVLERLYQAEVSGDASAWTLELAPTDPAVAGHLELLRVEGAGGQVRVLSIRERNGDHSRMELSPDG